MNASKEQASVAIQNLKDIQDGCDKKGRSLKEEQIGLMFSQIQNFLEVAYKKLPTEEAYARELSKRRERGFANRIKKSAARQ